MRVRRGPSRALRVKAGSKTELPRAMMAGMRRAFPVALFWFVYMGALGIFLPYYSLYLDENAGLSGTEVGVVLSMFPLVGIVAQPFWGHVADRTGARSRILVFLSFASALAYVALAAALGVLAGGVRWLLCGLSDSFYVIYPVQMLHGVMVSGLMLGGPLYVDAVVPERLRSTAQALLSMVGLGIAGIASNTAAGWLLEHAGANAPYLIAGIGGLILGFLVPWLLPATKAIHESN